MSEPKDKANRLQQSLPAALIVGLAVWVAYVSFNVDDPEPYLFPRLVSVGLVFLSGLALFQAITGKGQPTEGLNTEIAVNIAPALVVMAGFVFYAVEFLGMFTASTLAFLLVQILYDPSPHTEAKTWVRRIIVTAGFMAVMYGLFSLLLKVQTPRGLFL
jgi:hypothetical protein